MSAKPGTTQDSSMPAWWPRGVSEQLVRDCNCDSCAQLIDRLDDEHHAVADGQPSLSAFAGEHDV